jgi:hypothetical protein
VTDLPRLINLQEDLNLDEFDLIMFRNWPDEGADQEVWWARGYTNEDVEDFLLSIKQAVVDGKSLEVTNPNLASRLGLISGAQPIPLLRDRDNDGETDKRGQLINPWDIEPVKNGKTYLDVHANNWHRVVSLIPNLTEVPADSEYEFIDEVILTFNRWGGQDGNVLNTWYYNLSDTPLTIGREVFSPASFMGRMVGFAPASYGFPITASVWDRYVWAVTPDGLNVGTPVYKFNNLMWEGSTQVLNPYRDYIGGAVVQPGDTWGGVNVAGKVFMNFAESPFWAFNSETFTRQIVPPNDELPITDRENAQMREFDYSFTRVVTVGSATSGGGSGKGIQSTEITMLQDQSGVWYTVQKASTGKPSTLPTLEIIEKYRTETVVVPTWAMLGFSWLANTESTESGSVVIRPTSANAEATMPTPTATAQKSVVITAQVTSAVGVMRSPAEAHDPDVAVPVLPMEGSAAMTGYGKTIAVAPFEATAELVDNFDLINAAGEQVVLYLHYVDAEVYLKEDAR